MTLQAFVDSLDGVAEEHRGLYVQDGDRFRINADGIEDVSGLKSALEKERAEKRAAKDQLNQFAGVDLDEFNELKSAAEKAAQSEAEKKGEWDKLRQSLVEKHQEQLAMANKEKDAMRASLEKYLIDSQAATALASVSDTPELLLPHIKNSLRVVQGDDGNFGVQVVDAAGNARIGDSNGALMTIGQLVDEMKQNPTYAVAFKGTGAQGSGATGSKPGGAGNQSTLKRSEMTPKQKSDFMAAMREEGKNPTEEYFKLPT